MEPWVQEQSVARTSFILPRRHIFLTLSAVPWERPSSSSVLGSRGKLCKPARRRRRNQNLQQRRPQPREGEIRPAPCWPASARMGRWRRRWRKRRWIKWSLHSENSILTKMDFYPGKNFNRLGDFYDKI